LLSEPAVGITPEKGELYSAPPASESVIEFVLRIAPLIDQGAKAVCLWMVLRRVGRRTGKIQRRNRSVLDASSSAALMALLSRPVTRVRQRKSYQEEELISGNTPEGPRRGPKNSVSLNWQAKKLIWDGSLPNCQRDRCDIGRFPGVPARPKLTGGC